MSGDRLSRCASALMALMQENEAADVDLAAFGAPSECYGLVHRSQEKKAMALVRSFGFETMLAFVDELEVRTTAKFVYETGFGSLVRDEA